LGKFEKRGHPCNPREGVLRIGELPSHCAPTCDVIVL
jgi:hypothetical protein